MRRETIAILCADEHHEDLARLRDALDRISGAECLVEGFRNGGRLAGRIGQLRDEGIPVPVVFVDETLMDGPGAEALLALHESEPGAPIRKVLVTRDTDAPDLSRAIRSGALDGTVAKPWTDQQLLLQLSRLLTEYFVERDPAALERLTELADVAVLSHAYSVERERARTARNQLAELQSSFFADDGMSDDDVERAMIEEIDRVLGRPERQFYPAGSTLLRMGDRVTGIQIVLWGTVRLFRTIDGEEVTFHSRTAGRIIGLLAVARTQPASFSCVAETDVEVIPLSFEEVSDALHRSPTLAVHFVSVLVRSLARRNLRSVELQLERDRLTKDLEAERDHLRRALLDLDETRTRLVESGTMATLGLLASGIGRQLGRCTAGVAGAAATLEKDLEEVRGEAGSAEMPALDAIRACIARVEALAAGLEALARGGAEGPTEIDVREGLDLTLLLLSDALGDVEVDRRYQDVPAIRAYPGELVQVWSTLLGRAAAALAGEGILSIRTGEGAGAIEVEISDSGPSIPTGDLAGIFDFEPGAARDPSGFELWMAYDVVRRHGGRIDVVSEPARTAFRVRLPLGEEPQPPAGPGATAG